MCTDLHMHTYDSCSQRRGDCFPMPHAKAPSDESRAVVCALLGAWGWKACGPNFSGCSATCGCTTKAGRGAMYIAREELFSSPSQSTPNTLHLPGCAKCSSTLICWAPLIVIESVGSMYVCPVHKGASSSFTLFHPLAIDTSY